MAGTTKGAAEKGTQDTKGQAGCRAKDVSRFHHRSETAGQRQRSRDLQRSAACSRHPQVPCLQQAAAVGIPLQAAVLCQPCDKGRQRQGHKGGLRWAQQQHAAGRQHPGYCFVQKTAAACRWLQLLDRLAERLGGAEQPPPLASSAAPGMKVPSCSYAVRAAYTASAGAATSMPAQMQRLLLGPGSMVMSTAAGLDAAAATEVSVPAAAVGRRRPARPARRQVELQLAAWRRGKFAAALAVPQKGEVEGSVSSILARQRRRGEQGASRRSYALLPALTDAVIMGLHGCCGNHRRAAAWQA